MVKLTRALAWAAATDTANRQMRRNGRNSWSLSDYNVAVMTFDRLWPLERGRGDGSTELSGQPERQQTQAQGITAEG